MHICSNNSQTSQHESVDFNSEGILWKTELCHLQSLSLNWHSRGFVFIYFIFHPTKIKHWDVFYTIIRLPQEDDLSKTTIILSVMSAFILLHQLLPGISWLVTLHEVCRGSPEHTRHPHCVSCLPSFFSFPRAFLLRPHLDAQLLPLLLCLMSLPQILLTESHSCL